MPLAVWESFVQKDYFQRAKVIHFIFNLLSTIAPARTRYSIKLYCVLLHKKLRFVTFFTERKDYK